MKLFCCANKPSAKVVDGKLILSLPSALKPVVWQMDLNEVKESALEVVQGDDKGAHKLMLKPQKGAVKMIAEFENRSKAVNALMAGSKALESAQGRIGVNTGVASAQEGGASRQIIYKERPVKRWPSVVLGVLLLFILFLLWGGLANQNSVTSQTSVNGNAGTSSVQQSPVGVPLSADDFLKGQ